jgi:chemotaxis signal transduction protein
LWLVCRIGDGFYGINMRCVEEICRYEKPRDIAGAPEHLVGLLRRGQTVVSVADLRIRMGMRNPSVGPSTAIVVVKVAGDVFGCIVDAAREAIELPSTRMSRVVQVAACGVPFTRGFDSQGDTAAQSARDLVQCSPEGH